MRKGVLQMELYENRLIRARERMSGCGVNALLLPPSTDLFYFTSYQGVATDRPVLFLLTQEESLLLLPSFEAAAAEKTLEAPVRLLPWEETGDPFVIAAQMLPYGTVAVGARMFSRWLLTLQGLLPDCRWVPGDLVTAALRRKKDVHELSCIETAQRMAEAALEQLLKEPFEGKTERPLAGRLNELRREVGLTQFGDPLIASGENCADPHHRTGTRVIQKGDSVMLDFGGCYQGYRADMTRTFFVGPPTEKQRAVYETVLGAHFAAAAAIRPGVTGETVDAAGRAVIAAAGYSRYFTHRLGHGIGLDSHEEPFLVAGNNTPLEVGNVFSDEPGIYLPGEFGVRIEDLVCVTEDGCRTFNHFPTELISVV